MHFDSQYNLYAKGLSRRQTVPDKEIYFNTGFTNNIPGGAIETYQSSKTSLEAQQQEKDNRFYRGARHPVRTITVDSLS